MTEQKCKNNITGEIVEKVPNQTLRGNAEENDFTKCATINDLTMAKGCETPQNQALTILKGFSTVSEAIHFSLNPRQPTIRLAASTYKSRAGYTTESCALRRESKHKKSFP